MRVELRHIAKSFGAATALKGVDLELRAGEIHALLGENGAGKSTLMHVLSGAISADQGEIRVDGKTVRIASPRAARRLGIAMVHQHFTLVPAFTVSENLALDATAPRASLARLARRLNYSSRQDADAALERARSLGWQIEPDARVGDLPVGTQQRVEIVKALATGARTLIFDEPTAVLAGNEVEELFGVLRRLRSEGCTVVLIAHKLAEILAVADWVTVLRHGERVASAPRGEADARQLAAWMMGIQPISPERPAQGAAHAARPRPVQPADPGVGLESSVNTPAPVIFTAENVLVMGDRGETAIREVSLSVRAGEILGVGGVDGNGQTELAEALVGLRPLQSGSLKWDGGAFSPGIAPPTGYIPQDRRRSGLAVTMSVEENLLLDAVQERAFRTGPFLRSRALHATASALIAQFDIRVPGLHFPVSSLSGGNQQKIVVARALRSQPDWIVAVNPTRGLDIGATRFVRQQLRQARDRGAAILLISTDMDEITALSDRAAILSGGHLTEYRLDGTRVEDIGLLLGGLAVGSAESDEIGGTGL